MRKLVSFILCGLVVLYFLVSPADSKDMGKSVCILQNAPVQCSHFCLAALRPISDGIRGTQDKWVRLESKLLAVEKLLEVFEKRLTLVEGHLQEIRTLQDALPDTLSRIFFKIPPDFERIGSRYFYIEHERKNLTEAVDSCLWVPFAT
nr:uncharacterized protein LOC108018871 [Drosophila suzukii]